MVHSSPLLRQLQLRESQFLIYTDTALVKEETEVGTIFQQSLASLSQLVEASSPSFNRTFAGMPSVYEMKLHLTWMVSSDIGS